jgi:hypothetical protein
MGVALVQVDRQADRQDAANNDLSQLFNESA